MRVIAGTLKGRRLSSPSWDGLRPTSDKLRETLFNILTPRIVGARVLDGFAGTGALGIEALSRGAASVVFVERDRRAQGLIAANLAHCRVETGYTVERVSLARCTAAWRADPVFERFDIVLLDPPYDQRPDAILEDAAFTIGPDGLIVLEHARRTSVPDVAGELTRTRQVHSGDSTLSFYELAKAPILHDHS